MTIKAEWIEATDKNICLCCGQTVLARPDARLTPAKAERDLFLFEALGYTRESLLTKHREQIDYQLPGFAEWLQGQ
jgi:hypothetical protein|nr:hypothetical protein [Bradyrhizobium sp.]